MQSAMLHFESSGFGTDPSETEHTNPDIHHLGEEPA
jgi:hypothetical protein